MKHISTNLDRFVNPISRQRPIPPHPCAPQVARKGPDGVPDLRVIAFSFYKELVGRVVGQDDLRGQTVDQTKQIVSRCD